MLGDAARRRRQQPWRQHVGASIESGLGGPRPRVCGARAFAASDATRRVCARSRRRGVIPGWFASCASRRRRRRRRRGGVDRRRGLRSVPRQDRPDCRSASSASTASKITMGRPKLTGFRRDGRAYVVNAAKAIQDVTRPTVGRIARRSTATWAWGTTVRSISPPRSASTTAPANLWICRRTCAFIIPATT